MIETAIIKASFLICAALIFMAVNSGSVTRFYKNYRKMLHKDIHRKTLEN